MVECQLKLKWIRGYGMKFEYSLPDLKRLKRHQLRAWGKGAIAECGVYALFYKGKLVYVGQSSNVYKRLTCHLHKYGYTEMKYAFYRLPNAKYLDERQIKQKLHAIESIYIYYYNPKRNYST